MKSQTFAGKWVDANTNNRRGMPGIRKKQPRRRNAPGTEGLSRVRPPVPAHTKRKLTFGDEPVATRAQLALEKDRARKEKARPSIRPAVQRRLTSIQKDVRETTALPDQSRSWKESEQYKRMQAKKAREGPSPESLLKVQDAGKESPKKTLEEIMATLKRGEAGVKEGRIFTGDDDHARVTGTETRSQPTTPQRHVRSTNRRGGSETQPPSPALSQAVMRFDARLPVYQ